MRKDEFFQSAVLAVLPACATYNLNGLNEAIKHEEDKLLDEGYPDPAIARRVLPKIEEFQKGAYNATTSNALALASAVTNAVFAAPGRTREAGERFTPLSRAELDEIKNETETIARSQKRQEAERGKGISEESKVMAAHSDVLGPLRGEDGEGSREKSPDPYDSA